MPIHCWKDGPPYTSICPHGGCADCDFDLGVHIVGSSCLLLDGHGGDHDFTPDDEITVKFVTTAEAEEAC